MFSYLFLNTAYQDYNKIQFIYEMSIGTKTLVVGNIFNQQVDEEISYAESLLFWEKKPFLFDDVFEYA